MRLEELLRREETAIKQRWEELVINTYPADAHKFFREQKDQFHNPVGAALSKLTDELFNSVMLDLPLDEGSTAVEDFIKIRAVQEFTPSQAIAFILFLKQAVFESLRKEIEGEGLFQELREIDSRIDNLMLAVFNLYVKAKVKMYEIKAEELKRSMFMAFKLKERREKSNNE